MKTPDKPETIEYFERLLAQHGNSHLTLDWNSEISQKLRFAILLDIFSFIEVPKRVSLLDVGCGLGHLYGFLEKEGLLKKYNIDYTGYDLSATLVKAAKELYSRVDFEVKDIAEEGESRKFDFAVGSGLFNLRFKDQGSHEDYILGMLSRLFHVARVGVAVNFLTQEAMYYVPEENKDQFDRYYFHNPAQIVSLAQAVTPRLVMRNDYYRGDFTVYLLK